MLGSELKLSDIIMGAFAQIGYDFNGLPDKMYINRIRTTPLECVIPKIPVDDKLTNHGEQAVLFLPDSVRRRPKLLDPILRRFPNYLLYGTRRDIISGNPLETYQQLEELCDSSLRCIQEKGIDPDSLTVLGICTGNSPATILASRLSARNLYSVLSAGEISEGVFSSDATKNELADLTLAGIDKESYHKLVRDFDPIRNLDKNIGNIIGVFGGTDRMAKRSAWEPLAKKIEEVGGEVRVYKNLGHCATLYKFTRDLERKYI